MKHPQTIEQRLKALEKAVFDTTQWYTMTQAAKALGCSISLLKLRCTNNPGAKWWRWNQNETRRQINIKKYREHYQL